VKRILLLAIFLCTTAQAQDDKIQLETTRIKANKELPQILYIVPWKDFKSTQGDDHKLRLHNFFGDLYDPVLPSQLQEAPILSIKSEAP